MTKSEGWIGRNLPTSSTENKLWISPIDKSIKEAEHEAPFYGLTAAMFDSQIRTSIAKVMAMYGIKEPPSKEEIGLLQKMIAATHKYSRLNRLQFDQAFTFNLSGEWEPIKPFGIFSIEFMCNVLNAYNTRRTISIKERPKLPPVYEKPADMQRFEKMKVDNAIMYFEKYCADESCTFLNPTDVFLFLESKGLITETKENKIALYETARVRRMAELKATTQTYSKQAAQTLKETIIKMSAGGNPESEIAYVKMIARDLALRKWFSIWKEAKFDLTGKLKTQ